MMIHQSSHCFLFSLLILINHAYGFVLLNPQNIQRNSKVQEFRSTYVSVQQFSKNSISMSLQNDAEPINDFQAMELSSKLRGTNIYLVGLMGTGKSAVGKVLAEKLNRYTFLDTDVIIEDVAQKPIPKIFEDDGEDSFRKIETSVLDQVCAFVRCVVGTGGGIVCRQENWSYLQTGIVVWLNMEVEDIIERLKKDEKEIETRPLLKGDDPQGKLEALLEERTKFYEQADVTVDIAPFMDLEMVASNVVEAVLELIEKNPPKYKEWKAAAEERGTI